MSNTKSPTMLKRLLAHLPGAIMLSAALSLLVYYLDRLGYALPVAPDFLSSEKLLVIIGVILAWGIFSQVRAHILKQALRKEAAEREHAETALHTLNTSFEQFVKERTLLQEQSNIELDGWRRFLQATLDALVEHIAVLDKDGIIITVNRQWRKFAAEDRFAASNLGMGANYLDACLAPRDDIEARDIGVIHAGILSILKGERNGFHHEYPNHQPHEKRWFGMYVTSFGGNAADRFVVVAIENITARKLAEDELRLTQLVFANSSEGILVTDSKGTIESINPAFTTTTGYSLEEVVGKTPALLKSPRQPAAFYKNMWQILIKDGHWQGEIWNQNKNGDIFPQWLSINATKDDEGKTTHYVALYTDISEIKLAEDRLFHIAHHDALTGLPNRTLFQDRLSLAITQAKRNKSMVAVMFLDLDHFKRINDTLGHDLGDQLLQTMAARIQSCVREGDSVARMGGDEFTVILPNIKQMENAMAVAQKIIAAMTSPFTLGKNELRCSTSIGIALYPKDGEDINTLIKCADTAMYSTKKSGRNGFHFYTEDMNLLVQEHLAIENGLRKALAKPEFFLCYQPQVDLKTGKIVGTEALIRWRRKNGEVVDPAQFIPVAEECGLIVPIGEWVLITACTQAKAWLDAGLPPIRMAVNISARQFQQKGLVEMVTNTLRATGLPPHLLEVEITESLLMENIEETRNKLDLLHDMGISLALDDFGTGYSSLSYLKRLPIHIVKIDRSFIMDTPHDLDDVEITRAIISMSHNLNLKVVAEGIETEAQNNFLQQAGCDFGQGYLHCKPVVAEEVTRLLSAQKLAILSNVPKSPTEV